MLVVFLDFDGVLNHGAGPFCPVLVAHLNRITNLTGAVIVVHSSWRYGRTLDQLARMLDGAGVHADVLDVAPVPHSSVRGESGIIVLDPEDFAQFTQGLPPRHDYERPAAIQRWLDSHPEIGPEDFVILDDAQEFAHLAPRHLRTKMNVGLTREHAEEAIRMLLG